MQLLLDTHVLIWWITSDVRLSGKSISAIRNRNNRIYWSAVGSWEISIKCALGRLEFEEPPEQLIPAELSKNRIDTLPIRNEHAFLAGKLPLHHKDPFDRMLVAQAQIESLCIISNDSALNNYQVEILW